MALSRPKTNLEKIDPPFTDDINNKLQNMGGSKDENFNYSLLTQVHNSLWLAGFDAEGHDAKLRTAIAAMTGIRPGDEIEGMIAAQIVATHNAAMECFRRAMLENQTFLWRRESLNQANKLVRSYAALVEALNRYRGKGHQQVTVKHVHVNHGGQAIVGAVDRRRGTPGPDEAQTGDG